MSSLAETYALQVGVKLDKPFIVEHFYPLPFDYSKTIVIHASAGNGAAPAKVYDHYDEVVRLLISQTAHLGYKIVQIGGKDEPQINAHVHNIAGQTTFQQTAFILKNCALFIGNDSMNAHVAGSYGTPMVSIYGPTDVKNHGPFWKDEKKSIFIESHRYGKYKPSYFGHEQKKTINLIRPEQIVNAALSLLGLPTVNRESIFIGAQYRAQMVELIPDSLIRPDFLPEIPIGIRMDLLFNEENLIQMLQSRKCLIYIAKPVNIKILQALKKNIVGLIIKVIPETNDSYAKALVNLGCQIRFVTDSDDEFFIRQKRLELMDANIIIHKQIDATKEDFLKASEEFLNKKLDDSINLSEYSYKSTKFLVAKSGIYTSRAAWSSNRPINSFSENAMKIGELANNPEFWKEAQHYYIFK